MQQTLPKLLKRSIRFDATHSRSSYCLNTLINIIETVIYVEEAGLESNIKHLKGALYDFFLIYSARMWYAWMEWKKL